MVRVSGFCLLNIHEQKFNVLYFVWWCYLLKGSWGKRFSKEQKKKEWRSMRMWGKKIEKET